MHPFRKAVINNTSDDEFKMLFSEQVEFWAPMLTKPLYGRDFAVTLLSNAGKVLGKPQYTREIKDISQTLLFWQGQADGHLLQAVTILKDDENTGLISQVRFLMRPWPIVSLFVTKMHERLFDLIPEEYWQVQAAGNPNEDHKFSPVKLVDLPFTEDLTLHSPIFGKALQGRDWVIKGLSTVHQIQSPSSYTSIIASPELKIEVFDCKIAAHAAEGIWVSKINPAGKVYDLTVYLRPYPVVSLLRERAKATAEQDPEQREYFKTYWDIS
ncbi:hypothetical protein [Pedobacter aquatilis]|uniref:hypothetical protein n=1 Tax=Pedobacter aquatilis TaxID=351343 RepID=UPI00292CB030|nr:hypothetical protein [Pedobacter aquatilis]